MRIIACLFLCVVERTATGQEDSLAIYMKRGEVAFEQSNYEDARRNFQVAVEIASKSNSPEQTEILNNLGNIASYVGQSEQAILYYQDALRKTSLSKKPKEFEARILKNIGATYSDLKDFKNAISYLSKAESIAAELGNEDLLADCLNNRGIIYEQTDSLPSSLKVYSQALSIYRRMNNPDGLALIFINIGVVSKAMNDLPNAKTAYDSALHYSKLLGNDYYTAASMNNLGNVLSAMNNYSEAIKVTQEALQLARSIGHVDVVQNCLNSLAEQYHAMGKESEAYLYQQQYISYHDSLINVERVNSLSEMETRYEVEKKELQLSKLTAENLLKQEENKRSRLFLLVLLLLVLVLVVFFVFRIRYSRLQSRKRELELVSQTEKQERERIAKDMHDELGSGISRITWITASAARSQEVGDVKQHIHSIEGIAEQLSTGMKSLIWLLNSGNCEWGVLSGRIREMAAVFSEEQGFEVQFAQENVSPHLVVQQNAARDLFLICKEALHNISKYGEAKNVKFVFHVKKEEAMFEWILEDDGCGFDMTKNTNGHGLNNIRKRVQDLGGSAELTSSPGSGTRWSFLFPIGNIFISLETKH